MVRWFFLPLLVLSQDLFFLGGTALDLICLPIFIICEKVGILGSISPPDHAPVMVPRLCLHGWALVGLQGAGYREYPAPREIRKFS